MYSDPSHMRKRENVEETACRRHEMIRRWSYEIKTTKRRMKIHLKNNHFVFLDFHLLNTSVRVHPGDVKGPTNPTWFGRWELPSNEKKCYLVIIIYTMPLISKGMLCGLNTFDLTCGYSVS